MVDKAPVATKDEEFASKIEKFGERFPNPEDYEGFSDYITAINEGTDSSEEEINDLRDSAIADLEELKENWEGVKEQIEELLTFAKETFPKED